jgi:hypothetical protein
VGELELVGEEPQETSNIETGAANKTKTNINFFMQTPLPIFFKRPIAQALSIYNGIDVNPKLQALQSPAVQKSGRVCRCPCVEAIAAHRPPDNRQVLLMPNAYHLIQAEMRVSPVVRLQAEQHDLVVPTLNNKRW